MLGKLIALPMTPRHLNKNTYYGACCILFNGMQNVIALSVAVPYFQWLDKDRWECLRKTDMFK